jgi:hypothetical protein
VPRKKERLRQPRGAEDHDDVAGLTRVAHGTIGWARSNSQRVGFTLRFAQRAMLLPPARKRRKAQPAG